MATFRDKVVSVTLVYGATTISETQFDIPLILTGHNATGNLVDVFTSTDAVLAAGFSVNSPAYVMSELLFNGLFSPDEVIIGKREVTAFTLTPEAEDSTAYTISIKHGTASKTFSFTSDTDATVAEITAGLAALINADTTYSTYFTVASSSTAITLTPVSGVVADFAYSDNFVATKSFASNITEDISAIAEKNNTWFFLLSDSHESSDVEACASYVEEHDKVYFFSSQDEDIRDNVDDNLLITLVNTGYINTCFALWMSDADVVYPEAAVVGSICSAQPGTTTLHGKTLVGVTLEQLTTTQETNIVSNNGNIYRKEHGLLFYRDGFMVNGYFFDYVCHALWFKARVEESLFSLFKQQSMLGSGVRATTSGLALIRQAVLENPINVGILNGSIANEVVTSEDTGMYVNLKPTVYIPSRADMTNTQINSRIVEGMKIEYVYAGFLHYVKVQVNVLTNRTATTTSTNSNTTTVSA